MSFGLQEQILNKIVSIYFQLVLSNLLMIILIVYYLILIFDFIFNKISIKNQKNTICNSQKQDLDDCIISSQKQDLDNNKSSSSCDNIIILEEPIIINKSYDRYEKLYKNLKKKHYKCFRCNDDEEIYLFDPIELKYSCCDMHDCFIRFMQITESSLCCYNSEWNIDSDSDSEPHTNCNKTCKGNITIQDFIKNKKSNHMCKKHYYNDY